MLALLALCSGLIDAQARADDPQAFERPALVRYHMRRHMSDVRTMERMLLGGHLDEAKALAYMLTLPIQDPGMARWSDATDRVARAAGDVTRARTIDEALDLEVRVADACAACHLQTQRGPIFRTPSKAPAERATLKAQMARHQWAVDRLWEGVIGGSDTHWRAGLYVLAQTPAPFAKLTGEPEMQASLQKWARSALDSPQGERTARYAELLRSCAACHAKLR